MVAYDAQGRAAAEQTLHTAGAPAALRLDTWTQHSPQSPVAQLASAGTAATTAPARLTADGQDLAFVTVTMVDADGNAVPWATDQLTFDVEGAGTFRAACNGDATSLEPFTQPAMRLFAGQLVVIVQAARQPGTLRLTVTDPQAGLKAQTSISVGL